MAGGKAPRQKGDRFERWCVNTLKALGVAARRVPLSGAAQIAGDEWRHDLRVVVGGEELPIECKERAAPWLGTFYGWFKAGPRYLFVRATRGDTLVVMPLAEFARLVRPDPDDWSVE